MFMLPARARAVRSRDVGLSQRVAARDGRAIPQPPPADRPDGNAPANLVGRLVHRQVATARATLTGTDL